MVAEVQKRGGIAGFIDAEHALDPVYARNIGVDIDNLYISQPDNGEQALEITETMVRSGAVDIVIVDSVAALVPKAEIAVSYTHLDVYKRQPLLYPLSYRRIIYMILQFAVCCKQKMKNLVTVHG